MIHHSIGFGSLSTHQTMTPAGGNLKISNHHPSRWLWVKILIQQKWTNRIDSYQFRAIVWSSMVSFWDMVIWCIIYMILKYSNRFKTKQINPNRMVIWYSNICVFSTNLLRWPYRHEPINPSAPGVWSMRSHRGNVPRHQKWPPEFLKNTSKTHQNTNEMEFWKKIFFQSYHSHIFEDVRPYYSYIYIYGSVSKPCTPVVHIKIAGIYGCSFP